MAEAEIEKRRRAPIPEEYVFIGRLTNSPDLREVDDVVEPLPGSPSC